MSNKYISSESNTEYNKLCLEGHFTDAVIKVEDVEFGIHKIILCNCSSYFRSLFSCRSTRDKKVFVIRGLSPDMMQLIVEFAYSGTVSVTENNARELLLAAEFLDVMAIKRACCDFLGEQLCSDNCISIWHFSNVCSFPLLRQKAYQFILDNFEQVVASDGFQQLSAQELSNILDRDDLNIKKESTAFEAVHQWMAYPPEDQIIDLVALLSKVRLALISSEYISMHVVSSNLVSSSAECRQMVENAMQIKAWMNTSNPPLSGVRNTVARPRLPNAILLAVGGWSGRYPTNSTEAYDVRSNNWINVTNSLELPRAYHGMAFISGCVYCIGGCDRAETFNSVRRFDLSTRTWHEAAPMYFRRCYVSVTVLEGYIYALGGFDGLDRLSTAERYRPETNQWSLIESMHVQRSDASCTTLHGKVYICGGFNGRECLSSCECYSPEANQWSVITPMTIQRSGIGVVAYADHVYAVGGYDGNVRLQSAEAYNPRTNNWHSVSSMLTPRSNFGIEVIDGQLFAVGGFNGTDTTSNVEFYDTNTNEWTEAHGMEVSRSALSCCVVSRLPNMAEYTVPRDTLPLFQLENGLVVSRNL